MYLGQSLSKKINNMQLYIVSQTSQFVMLTYYTHTYKDIITPVLVTYVGAASTRNVAFKFVSFQVYILHLITTQLIESTYKYAKPKI